MKTSFVVLLGFVCLSLGASIVKKESKVKSAVPVQKAENTVEETRKSIDGFEDTLPDNERLADFSEEPSEENEAKSEKDPSEEAHEEDSSKEPQEALTKDTEEIKENPQEMPEKDSEEEAEVDADKLKHDMEIPKEDIDIVTDEGPDLPAEDPKTDDHSEPASYITVKRPAEYKSTEITTKNLQASEKDESTKAVATTEDQTEEITEDETNTEKQPEDKAKEPAAMEENNKPDVDTAKIKHDMEIPKEDIDIVNDDTPDLPAEEPKTDDIYEPVSYITIKKPAEDKSTEITTKKLPALERGKSTKVVATTDVQTEEITEDETKTEKQVEDNTKEPVVKEQTSDANEKTEEDALKDANDKPAKVAAEEYFPEELEGSDYKRKLKTIPQKAPRKKLNQTSAGRGL